MLNAKLLLAAKLNLRNALVSVDRRLTKLAGLSVSDSREPLPTSLYVPLTKDALRKSQLWTKSDSLS